MSSRLPPGERKMLQLRQMWIEVQVWLLQLWATLLGAIAFYTCLPIPAKWPMIFQGIARCAPVAGVLIGGGLAGLNWLFVRWGIPDLTRSVLLVLLWLAVTGGLHLDGAMDTADGLAVQDPERRLPVMSDSATGAFGAMAAVAILLLKVAALSDLHLSANFALIAAAGWGRWGQLVAIARFPYLKAEGKGAFHKAAIRSFWDVVPGFLLLVAISGVQIWLDPFLWREAVGAALAGFAIAILTGAWFARQLGGHTGDTYGAVVEWTEALLLGALTIF